MQENLNWSIFITLHKVQVQVDQRPQHKTRYTESNRRKRKQEIAQNTLVQGKIPQQNTNGSGSKIIKSLGKVLLQYPTIPLLGIYPKDVLPYHKNICSPMFRETLFIIARNWNQLRCLSTEKWIRKLWYSYTIQYYSDIKNKTS